MKLAPIVLPAIAIVCVVAVCLAVFFSENNEEIPDEPGPAFGTMVYDPERTLADLTLPDGWTWDDDTICPTVNGAYWAMFILTDVNGAPTSKLIPLTITPKPLKEPTAGVMVFVYDGTEKTPSLSGFDPMTMTVSNDAMTDIGDYTTVIGLIDGVNYRWASGILEVTFAWSIVEDLPDTFDASPRLTGGILHFTTAPGAAEYIVTVNGTVVGIMSANAFDLSAVKSLKSELPWIKPDTNIAYAIKVYAIGYEGKILEIANFTHKSEIGVTEISSTLHRWKLGNTARFNEIYDLANQEAVRGEIDDLIANYEYTPKNPLVIKNPFGTNELGLYVYFETQKDCKVSYTVKALGTPVIGDFTRIVNGGKYGTVHEFQIMGLVHQRLCEIDVELETIDAVRTASAIRVNGQCSTTPPNLSVEEKNDPDGKITEGMFAVFEAGARYNIHLFDNDGIRRGYITCGLSYTRFLFDDDGNWIFDGAREKIVVMNQLGEVIRIYHTPGYVNHHDLILGANNDILKLGTGGGQTEDIVLSVDRDTGAVTIINMRDFFPGYDFGRNGGDWFHSNSMSIVPESDGSFSLLISSREMSAIVKIKDLYGTPSLDWMITDNTNMTPYGTILTKINGIPNLGQHTITYIKHDETYPDKYYVHFFNNMFENSTSNNSYTDNIYDFTGLDPDTVAAIRNLSSMDIYLIDEAAGTCELIQTVQVTYSIFMSSSQIYMDNYIIGSSYGPYVYECDSDGNVLVKFKFGSGVTSPQFYRTMKYNF